MGGDSELLSCMVLYLHLKLPTS